MLIDTHSHIYCEEFDVDRDEVVRRALDAGIGMILLPAIDEGSYCPQEALASSRPGFFRQMMGLHPTSVNVGYEQALQKAHDKLFGRPTEYVAVGEVGLDFYWDTTFRDEQCLALVRQIEWAEELGKPLALHLRSGKDGDPSTDAYAEMFRILERFGGTRCKGVMHCFSGTLSDALRAVEMGFLLGVGGTLTYKKSTLPDIMQAVPIGMIVLETDDPYLAPVPHRGQRNEPSFMVDVAERLAAVKGMTFGEVAAVTSANARKLFG